MGFGRFAGAMGIDYLAAVALFPPGLVFCGVSQSSCLRVVVCVL